MTSQDTSDPRPVPPNEKPAQAPESMLPLAINKHTPSVIICADGYSISVSWRDNRSANPYGRAEQAAAFLVAVANAASPALQPPPDAPDVPGAVTVKALEWIVIGERARAKCSIGEYVVGKVGLHFGWVNNGLSGWNHAQSFEAAKIAAQVDYERRILSAITTKPAQGGEDGALREALVDARDNGLIYWEPNTERGRVNKALMFSRIDAALASLAGVKTEPLAKVRDRIVRRIQNDGPPRGHEVGSWSEQDCVRIVEEEFAALASQPFASQGPAVDPAHLAAIKALRDAGKKLSIAAQTTGGTAGRDEGLVEAIAGWEKALHVAKDMMRVARYESATPKTPSQEARLRDLDGDIAVLLANIEFLEEALGEKLEDEDAEMVARIRANHRTRAALQSSPDAPSQGDGL